MNYLESSNILSIGFTAFAAISGSTMISGASLRRASATFSSVLSFMNSHSLQLHSPVSAGAARKVFSGHLRRISKRMPLSVTTINSLASSWRAKSSRAAVEPTLSAINCRGRRHSGCTSTLASGCSCFISCILVSEKRS